MNTPFDWNLVLLPGRAGASAVYMGAARALQSSQPTMGRHMSPTWRRNWARVLFERTGRGLQPTATALRHSHIGAREADGMRWHAASPAQGRRQRQRCASAPASPWPACCRRPCCCSMRQALPDIQSGAGGQQRGQQPAAPQNDIALRMVQPDQSSLVARRIGSVALGAFAHRDYLRRRGTPRQPTDLLAHELVGNDRNEDILRGFAALGHPVGREQFPFAPTTPSPTGGPCARAWASVSWRTMARTDPEVLLSLPQLAVPTLPSWLTVPPRDPHQRAHPRGVTVGGGGAASAGRGYSLTAHAAAATPAAPNKAVRSDLFAIKTQLLTQYLQAPLAILYCGGLECAAGGP